ncbi:hypothetical protein K7432_018442 [Basidiobolus ranarum]|uniref:Uncharacterized protein n=1 Tax=Basidiobolus ranarum TaxID=34480 RepID=A0ABR2VJD1_9FUNG
MYPTARHRVTVTRLHLVPTECLQIGVITPAEVGEIFGVSEGAKALLELEFSVELSDEKKEEAIIDDSFEFSVDKEVKAELVLSVEEVEANFDDSLEFSVEPLDEDLLELETNEDDGIEFFASDEVFMDDSLELSIEVANVGSLELSADE